MRFSCGRAALQVIVLKEQPIALQETVVAAKSSKQRNKRKQMATLLHAVYVQLEKEFPDEPAQYQVVSDVRMTSGEAQFHFQSKSYVGGVRRTTGLYKHCPFHGRWH